MLVSATSSLCLFFLPQIAAVIQILHMVCEAFSHSFVLGSFIRVGDYKDNKNALIAATGCLEESWHLSSTQLSCLLISACSNGNLELVLQ